jgi:hypothetical protein
MMPSSKRYVSSGVIDRLIGLKCDRCGERKKELAGLKVLKICNSCLRRPSALRKRLARGAA